MRGGCVKVIKGWDWSEFYRFPLWEIPSWVGVYVGIGSCIWSGLYRELILWVMLGRSLRLVRCSWSKGRWAGGRTDIG